MGKILREDRAKILKNKKKVSKDSELLWKQRSRNISNDFFSLSGKCADQQEKYLLPLGNKD